jgi:2-methylisocitrate lyase-like PEP mutase family enzyme
VLVARTEGLLLDPAAVRPATESLVALADAGADCLYAPGVRDRNEIPGLVRAVAPKRLNVVMMRPGPNLVEFAERRVSIGGALARVMWATVVATEQELKNRRFDTLPAGVPAAAGDEAFRPFSAPNRE